MKIKGKIIVVSGLHIGGADDTMKIGGVDSPVIKREIKWNRESKKIDYINGELISEPYIPGSSLKGKIRSLLEHYFGLHKKLVEVYREEESRLRNINENEKNRLKRRIGLGESISSKHMEYFNENEKKYANLIIKLFGESGGSSVNDEITIASLIFRDAFLNDDIREKALNGDLELTEEKFENVIDRISGTTKSGGLRQIERVVPGVEFEYSVMIRDINDIDTELAKSVVFLGMKLLEEDYLGGNGSRGYGEIVFIGVDGFNDKSIEQLKQDIDTKLG